MSKQKKIGLIQTEFTPKQGMKERLLEAYQILVKPVQSLESNNEHRDERRKEYDNAAEKAESSHICDSIVFQAEGGWYD